MSSETPRRRRLASDEAHAWARNLRLGNPYAKLILCMLAIYVNGEGICFVGIEALADDTELSTDTVRKRLAWLERIGAIVRRPQWVDAGGRRNGDGRGRRTSDEVELLIHADPNEIEVRTKVGVDDIDPSQQQGSQDVSPRLALGRPSDSRKGLISELGTKNQEIDRCAREPLISKAALELADDCLIALGFEPQHPPIELVGLPYQTSMMLARGYDPPRVTAAFARFAGQPLKPLSYLIKVVETVCTAAPLASVPKNLGGQHERTNKSRRGGNVHAAIDRLIERFDEQTEAPESGGADGESSPRRLFHGGSS